MVALPGPRRHVAVSTPGAVDAWWTLHQRYGKLKWSEFCSSRRSTCAKTGVGVPQIIANSIRRNMAAFVRPNSGVEETVNAMHTYAPTGKVSGRGRLLPQPRSRQHLSDDRRRAAATPFYEGPIAQTIDAYFKRIGGWLSYDDLEAPPLGMDQALGHQPIAA